jgi:hypothetical protein
MPGVARSNRVRGTSLVFCIVSSVVERPPAPGNVAGSIPARCAIFAVIAQLVERSVEGAGVVGSIPTHGTI